MGAHLTFQVCIRMITFIPEWNYCFDVPQKCIRMITFIPQCNHCADVRQIRFGRVLVSRQSLNRRSPQRQNEISVGKTFILEIFIPQSSSFIRTWKHIHPQHRHSSIIIDESHKLYIHKKTLNSQSSYHLANQYADTLN